MSGVLNLEGNKPACGVCSNTSLNDTPTKPLLKCASCSKANIETFYCSQTCQKVDWKSHKSICGGKSLSITTPDLTSPVPPTIKKASIKPFVPTMKLLSHLEALSALRQNATDPSCTPSFMYFPSPASYPPPPSQDNTSFSSSAPSLIPIFLSEATSPLCAAVLATAAHTGNKLSLVLLFSFVIEAVEEEGGSEARLIAQLDEEFEVDMEALLEEDERNDPPGEDEMMEAVGGEGGGELLLAWQIEEAEKSR